MEDRTITTTIEIRKDLFLRFKAFCVLNESTISGEIEELIKKKVDVISRNGNFGLIAQ